MFLHYFKRQSCETLILPFRRRKNSRLDQENLVKAPSTGGEYLPTITTKLKKEHGYGLSPEPPSFLPHTQQCTLDVMDLKELQLLILLLVCSVLWFWLAAGSLSL